MSFLIFSFSRVDSLWVIFGSAIIVL
jgi:hypothetical protein